MLQHTGEVMQSHHLLADGLVQHIQIQTEFGFYLTIEILSDGAIRLGLMTNFK
jgi:hypothetical protein